MGKHNKLITTPYYVMSKKKNLLSIRWNNGNSVEISPESNEWNTIDIFKISDTELAYFIDNKLFYANDTNTEPKVIISGVDGSVYYSEMYRKFIIWNDQSDPPDILLIIVIDDIIKEPIIDIFSDKRTSYNKGKFYVYSSSDWSNDISVCNKYIYIIEENSERVRRIDIDTHIKITQPFENTKEIIDIINANINMGYGYKLGEEINDGIIVNVINSDEPDNNTILGSVEVKFPKYKK